MSEHQSNSMTAITAPPDEGNLEEVTVAAKGFNSPQLDEPELIGTRHIIIGAEPLCNHHEVQNSYEEGEYLTETREYPLSNRDLCEVCGRKYAREHGSNDETFQRLTAFEEGEWVTVTAGDGHSLTGRVKLPPTTTDWPVRSLLLVLSDEPRKRWLYGVEETVRIRLKEGGTPFIPVKYSDDDSRTLVEEISAVDPPANNIDAQTIATIKEIRETIGTTAKTVTTMGKDPQVFHANLRPGGDVWALADRLHDNGYEVTGVSHREERSRAVCHAISIRANSLVDATPDS